MMVWSQSAYEELKRQRGSYNMPRQPEKTNRQLEAQIAELETAVEKLQQSEEQFRLMVEGVHDYAIYMLNNEGIVSTWNSAHNGSTVMKRKKSSESISPVFTG